MKKQGTVYITGAGPGDPGLLTLKARKVLQKADVVIYDNLVNTEVLKYCPKETRRIYAGKKPGNHTLTQAETNQLLIDESKKGNQVVRLKGGDPFIFGRGAEEARELRQAGIVYEIIPGISSGSAAPAYAGIPLTYRGLSSSVVFVTGHEDPDKTETAVDWKSLAALNSTLVLYMGLGNLNRITKLLQKYGLPGDTAVSMIRWGTLAKQTVLHSTLSEISRQAQKLKISPPVITVIGEVASLGTDLDWYTKGPLAGKSIVVTRSNEQASTLSEKLKSLGADVTELPAIQIRRISDFSEIDPTIDHIAEFSWVFFTSVNSVNLFFKRVFEKGLDSRLLGGIKISAIGKATSEALGNYGVVPDLVPEFYNSIAMSEKLKSMGNAFFGQHVLLPGSSISGNEIQKTLVSLGAKIRKLDLYQTIPVKYETENVPDFSLWKEIIVTFTSVSTVSNFVEILKQSGLGDQINKIIGFSIGPKTTKKANELGVNIVAESNPHTIETLTETILNHFKKKHHELPGYQT